MAPRTGVRPERRARARAERPKRTGSTVGGVFTHGGHGYAGRAERVAAADGRGGRSHDCRRIACARTGSMPRVVSAGSTPTATLSARGAITEERPGTYIFGDRQQAFLADRAARRHGAARGGDGRQPRLGRRVRGRCRREDPRQGRGAVPPRTRQRSSATLRPSSHGSTTITGSSSCRPGRAGRPSGTWCWIAPNHVCPVVNLVDEYVVAQGGRIVGRWPVDARGRNA